MDDGYFDSYGRTQTLILCTENFTKRECLILVNVLAKIGIVATLKRRNVTRDTYRTRISKTSMPLVRKNSDTIYAYFYDVQARCIEGPSLNFTICWNTLKIKVPPPE